MENKIPMVSVIMTAYKGNQFLKTAVDSILSQSYQDFELIIVVDPHPKDICSTILAGINDSRLRVIINQKRIGLVRSRNVCLSHARGKYISVMDSDDVSNRDRFKKEIDYILKNNDCHLVGAQCEVIDENENYVRGGGKRITDTELYYRIHFANQLPHSSIMIERDLIEKVGGYREGRLAEDYDLFLRCLKYTRIHKMGKF